MNQENKLDIAVKEIIEDRENWDNTGRDLFQNILEGVFIEVEDEIAAKAKEAKNESNLDSTMDDEVNRIMSEEKWDDTESFGEFGMEEESEDSFFNNETESFGEQGW